MRWDNGGEGVVGGDDVDDDPDGARRDDDGDGNDSPLQGGISLHLTESLFSMSRFSSVAAAEK